MKKIIISLALSVMLMPCSKGQFSKIGGGVAYNYEVFFHGDLDDDKLLNPVLFLTGIYEFNLPFHISSGLNAYFPNVVKMDDVSNSYKWVTTGLSFDLDGHYVINSFDRLEVFGLLGLNILVASQKFTESGVGLPEPIKERTTNTSLGANIGVGTYFTLKEQVDLSFRIKAILAGQIQFMASAGILINIDLTKNSDDSGY